MLIDTHCHLDFAELAGDRVGVLARAAAAGVQNMVTISTHKSRLATYTQIAADHAHIFCSVGTHPHHVAEDGEAWAADDIISAITANQKIVGIGETGLDYYYTYATPEAQKAQFTQHIIAAQQTGLPLIIHARDADADVASMLQTAYAQQKMTGLLHCFSSGRDLAMAALEIGFYISFSGIVTFKNAADLRAIAADVPLDKMLVETDAPYLAPVPMRGKTNEPSFVAHTAQLLADIKGVSLADFAAATTENAKRIFSRMT